MQGTELVEGVILCFAVKFFCISINNLYLFFEPRPSKMGRGEGGLLWLRN